MTIIMTVTEPIAPEALGVTLMHEHLFTSPNELSMSRASGLEDVELAIDETLVFKRAGGGAIVEASTRRPLGVREILQIAKSTGLNIIKGTGYYTEPSYPPEVFTLSINQLADVIIRDLTEGIDGTDIKAGIIGEIGTGRGHISPAEERVFRAAARAQLATGVAISTHTYWGGELALEQIEILLDEGVPANRIIIGHLGDKRTIDYFAEIASHGVFIQFDHIGFNKLLPDADRAGIIKGILDRGYERQILLSSDTCWKTHLHHYGGRGYDHILTNFLPKLRTEGITEEQIQAFLVHNPRRALTKSN